MESTVVRESIVRGGRSTDKRILPNPRVAAGSSRGRTVDSRATVGRDAQRNDETERSRKRTRVRLDIHVTV